MKRIDFLLIILITLFYFTLLYLNNNPIYNYKFDPGLADLYLRSQDISHEVPSRIFLSDSQIHLAAGLLYAKGEEPTRYNFQHPPLIKYLYGISALLLGNPYFIQVGFGLVFLCLIYVLGIKIFQSRIVSILTAIFVACDPLFINLSNQLLLDLGQGVFLLLYFLAIEFYQNNILLQGITLGLMASSKFWGATLFFVGVFMFFKLIRKELHFRKFFLHLILAIFVFSLTYTKTFLDRGGNFNLVFFELKTLKYWLDHSQSTIPGSSIILFITGFFPSWWEGRQILKSDVWSLFWPTSFMISLFKIIGFVKRKKWQARGLTATIPVLYLFYLGPQATFARYYILILPFLYLTLSEFIYLICLKVKLMERNKLRFKHSNHV